MSPVGGGLLYVQPMYLRAPDAVAQGVLELPGWDAQFLPLAFFGFSTTAMFNPVDAP